MRNNIVSNLGKLTKNNDIIKKIIRVTQPHSKLVLYDIINNATFILLLLYYL